MMFNDKTVFIYVYIHLSSVSEDEGSCSHLPTCASIFLTKQFHHLVMSLASWGGGEKVIWSVAAWCQCFSINIYNYCTLNWLMIDDALLHFLNESISARISDIPTHCIPALQGSICGRWRRSGSRRSGITSGTTWPPSSPAVSLWSAATARTTPRSSTTMSGPTELHRSSHSPASNCRRHKCIFNICVNTNAAGYHFLFFSKYLFHSFHSHSSTFVSSPGPNVAPVPGGGCHRRNNERLRGARSFPAWQVAFTGWHTVMWRCGHMCESAPASVRSYI